MLNFIKDVKLLPGVTHDYEVTIQWIYLYYVEGDRDRKSCFEIYGINLKHNGIR